jgi:hypothetical protein
MSERTVQGDLTKRPRIPQVTLRGDRERLARELEDTKQLQRISSLLINEGNTEALYEQILDAAVAIVRADFGSIQMLDTEGRANCSFSPIEIFIPNQLPIGKKYRSKLARPADRPCDMASESSCPTYTLPIFKKDPENSRQYERSGIRETQKRPLRHTCKNVLASSSHSVPTCRVLYIHIRSCQACFYVCNPLIECSQSLPQSRYCASRYVVRFLKMATHLFGGVLRLFDGAVSGLHSTKNRYRVLCC